MRYRQALTIPIALRPEASQPLHEQIAGQIAAAIRAGAVPGGSRVPSTRTLADLLGVSRGVVAASYDLLRAAGDLVTRPGSGTFVRATSTMARPAAARPGSGTVDLRPGQLCAEAFPLQAWRAAWRQASYGIPAAEPAALGLPALREAIAGHLARQRGIVAPGHEVVVTGGLVAGLRLLAAGLEVRFGVRGTLPPALRRAIEPADPAGALIVCNRPLGTVTAEARRDELAAWPGTVIEIVTEGLPEPARLIDLCPQAVLAGAFCEVLTPTLKLGYLLVPKQLAPLLTGPAGDQRPSGLTQAAVTQLLHDGTIERQSRRLARLHTAKAAIVTELLGPLPPAQPGVAVLPVPDAHRAVQCLRRNGILVHHLAAYGDGLPEALVFGFGHLCDTKLRETLSHLLLSIREEWP